MDEFDKLEQELAETVLADVQEIPEKDLNETPEKGTYETRETILNEPIKPRMNNKWTPLANPDNENNNDNTDLEFIIAQHDLLEEKLDNEKKINKMLMDEIEYIKNKNLFIENERLKEDILNAKDSMIEILKEYNAILIKLVNS